MDEALVGRIGARLGDEARRTGDGDYLRLPKEIRDRDRPRHLLYGPVWNAMHQQALADLQPLKPVEPLSEAAVAKVEKGLGFRLPEELRQLHLELGDGGFGPFNGVRRLSNWAKDYSKLRAQLPAERGRAWPEALLPIVYRNGKRICVDRTTGAVLLWAKPPKSCSEKKWLASFVPQSPSLGGWLERWVDTPTEAEGGPEGGWAPPGEEVERRESVEREKEEQRAAELSGRGPSPTRTCRLSTPACWSGSRRARSTPTAAPVSPALAGRRRTFNPSPRTSRTIGTRWARTRPPGWSACSMR
jgi:hypothetical protein